MINFICTREYHMFACIIVTATIRKHNKNIYLFYLLYAIVLNTSRSSSIYSIKQANKSQMII